MEGMPLPFRGTTQKLPMSLLLTSHWPKLSNLATLAVMEVGKCSYSLRAVYPANCESFLLKKQEEGGY